MSKLEELIARLCPDGVEYKELGDIGTLTRGKRFVHADAVKNGIPCIHYGELYTYYGISTESTKSFVRYELHDKLRYASKNDVIIVGAGENDIDIGIAVAYMGEKEVAVHDACYILKHNEDPKYLSYCLRTSFYHEQIKKYVSSGKICAISSKGLSKAKLPVPPLEVQREIVHILDSFTLLTAELAAELAARQKQYAHYKEFLFESLQDIGSTTLDKISINRDSQRKPVTSSKREAGEIPYYGASGIVDYVKDYIFDGDYLLVSEDGANLLARSTPIAFSISGKTWVNNHAHILEFPNYHTRKFVEYYLNSIDLSPFISGGAQPKLNQKNLNKIDIPVPPLSEQQRIVDILDRFDALCNDITSGLPAEIEARKKQYEYYRDKLLTFKELKKEA